jgi:hypothetical protein
LETLEIHLTGKTTEKRQNFDPSTPCKSGGGRKTPQEREEDPLPT